MISRRQFLKLSAVAGASLAVPWKLGPLGIRRAYAQIPGGTLAPGDVAKYVLPLVKPPAMPQANKGKKRGLDYYEIAVRQFRQQILSPPHPMTTVWSYGSVDHPATFNYPAFTVEARHNKPVRVNWINDLKAKNGKFLPHILPVDPTLHWANPPGGIAGRDKRPTFATTPGSYTGPVPIVTHVHGAHTHEESDGYPEAWYLPGAKNIPSGYAMTGTWYDTFHAQFKAKTGQGWDPGTAVFQYPNDQRATTLWYHDHTLGMTRLNVYAGPAGFWLIRGGPNDLDLGYVAPGVGDNPFGEYTEIPIVIQDRSFNADGSLFYPDSRAFFDGYTGPFIPDTPVSPTWNPEFFGNVMVVNGVSWPFLQVEKRRYRFRLLNGCNSRFLVLKFDRPGLKFYQIGAEGGFLPNTVELDQLLMAPAERADVIVDFTDVPVGTEIILLNLGPDAPFGGFPIDPTELADPATTGQVMQFRVVSEATSIDTTTPPLDLALPSVGGLGPTITTRQVSLNEEMYEPADIPIAALLGTVDGSGKPMPLKWMDTITENPAPGDTEVWEILNFTEDAHPIHVHLVQFRVLGRGPNGNTPPEPWEMGFKDTVIAYPGEITRIKAKFDYAGLYVWHCHIVEHEDNEMMRPYAVGAIPPGL